MEYVFLGPGGDACEDFHKNRFFVCKNCGSKWDVLRGEVTIDKDYRGVFTINGIEYLTLGEYLRALGDCPPLPFP